MSLSRFHLTLITGWFVVLGAAFAVRVALGASGSVAQGVAWLSLGFVPAIILVAVFCGAPRQTIAQVLYEAEQASSRVGPGVAQQRNAAQARS